MHIKYSVNSYSYLTDGLSEHPHFAPIQKLVFISKAASGISKIGALDQQGVLSMWSVVEVHEYLNSDYDLNMNLGCKYKMVLNYSDNLLLYPHVIDLTDIEDIVQSVEIEFDPADPQVFFFSTSQGLFKKN